GVPREPGSENIWHMNAWKLFQEPALMHLTGINQPNVILALVPGGLGKFCGEEVLFLPGKNPEREFWDGVRFGIPPLSGARGRGAKAASTDLDDIRTLTGIADIRPLNTFDEWFEGLVLRWKKGRGQAFWHRY